jgi:NAD(P)-dependent dehydrogenase (short-subunit alcohol dehydrogenase family)
MNVMDAFSLEGKVALLVGGSGRYGRQITRSLVQAGAITYVTTRNNERLNELELQFIKEGLNPHVVYMDQSNEATIIKLRDQLLKQHGKIDILINNAVARPMSGWNDDTEIFAESMKVNATGIYSVTKIIGNVME